MKVGDVLIKKWPTTLNWFLIVSKKKGTKITFWWRGMNSRWIEFDSYSIIGLPEYEPATEKETRTALKKFALWRMCT